VTAKTASEQHAVVSRCGGVAISDSRRSFLAARLKIAILQQPEIKTLRALLLRVGGTELVAPPWRDCRASALIYAGFVMDGCVMLRTMRPCSCHRNASRLWSRKRNGLIGIGTGYALSGDGLWRQHSWGMGRRGIVETTEVRFTYFGQLLQRQDADLFAQHNR
jgi:hypothetical protein